MKAIGKALVPFVPSGPQFSLSLAFFQDLGFATMWQAGGLAGLKFGDAFFLLQDIDVPEWQKNQMIAFEVDDLAAYWAEVDALDLPGRYAAVKVKPPTDYPWGREIHIIDPGGVCWHVRQTEG
ncbi:MAG: glyoxalase [Ancalomicrobiaceae bacterium]|nr:glyoxalase [Ancalomicrobiaceae bacterium]